MILRAALHAALRIMLKEVPVIARLRTAPLLPLVLLTALAACMVQATPRNDPPPPALAPLPPELVGRNTRFALELYGQLRKRPGNLFFSPASISTALSMTWAGARGETAQQMASTMHFELPNEEHHAAQAALLARLSSSAAGTPQLSIANRIWSSNKLRIEPEFQRITAAYYGAALELVDFGEPEAARDRINTWVQRKTRGKIVNLLPPQSLSPESRMVLTNAIYFKGLWRTPFDKKQTRPQPFFTPDGAKEVPLMAQTLPARYTEQPDVQVLALSYKSRDPQHALSMVILLPRARDGLAQLEASLTTAQVGAYLEQLVPLTAEVVMPRFKVTQSFVLNESLAALGMPLPFDPDRADFSGIGPRLHISKVLHKAFVDVNEEGTEAAAATAVLIATDSVPPPTPTFRADHPFLFMLRDDQTGAVLFIGRVTDPTA